MPTISDPVVDQMLLSAAILFFLVWSVIGAVIGAGLVISSKRMFLLFGLLDRYVSSRHGMKPLAMAHDIGGSVHKHRFFWGTVFVAGAIYSIYGLVARFDGPILVAALNLPYPRAFVLWILESARWSLLAFSGFAVAIGVMLGFFPHVLARFEAWANRWISVRKLTLGGEVSHLPLDRVVKAFPRAAGLVILAGSLIVVANAAIAWSGAR